MYLPYAPRVKDQGRTKDKPRMNLRTPYPQKCCLLRFPFFYLSYTLPYSTERTPTDDRDNSDSTPCLQKVLFLKIAFLKRLTHILKLLTIFLKRFPHFVIHITVLPARFSCHYTIRSTPTLEKSP